MAKVVLPFSRENKADEHGKGFEDCALYKKLPPPFQEVVQAHPFLLEYLHMVPIDEVGLPEYRPRLTRKMEETKEPNIIYPVAEGIFAHVLADREDSRNHYITVEPTLTMELDELAREVESRCIEFGDRLPPFDTEGDHKSQLMRYVELVTVDGERSPVIAAPKKGLFRRQTRTLTRLSMNARELEGIKYLFVRDKIGLGVLDPVVKDPYIEDISCSGVGQLFIEHKIFGGLKSVINFATMEELDEFVLRLAEQLRKPVTYRTPIADATLPSGARINIVFGRDVSKRGSNFSIRRFSDEPLSIFELVEFGTIDYRMLAYLSLCLANGMNIFVAGESASGKTSMLNALTAFIPPTAKIVTIEDTPELQIPHENWIREVVASDKREATGAAVTTFDLLKAALRQRPNEIMVGEIRGPEGNIAFQAMQTGHSVMSTFHAASVQKLIQRMTAAPILVPKAYIDNLNVAVMMATVKLPSGKVGRRITSVDEIVGYDPPTESFNIVQAFKWDETTDRFDFTGHMTSFIMEHKIAPRMGLAGRSKQKVYSEIERRARIFATLHKERNVRGFYEVLGVLSRAQKEGLL